MNDVTNSPATADVWYQRYLVVRETDPVAVAMRERAAAHGIVPLTNLDQKAWGMYLGTKRAKGLVIEEA
jgi:hypothetical protein